MRCAGVCHNDGGLGVKIMVMKRLLLELVAVSFSVVSAEGITISSDVELRSQQIEGSHNNGGYENVTYDIIVPKGVVATVSVSGTMSSANCSKKAAYLIFSSDGGKRYFDGSANGTTCATTFTETSSVTLCATATPGQYTRDDSYYDTVSGRIIPKITYVTYSSYTCRLQYSLTVKYEKVTVSTYAVRYEPGFYGLGSMQLEEKVSGDSLALKGAIFSRSGYQQVGWSRNKDGSTCDFLLGETYDEDADVTLYPYWAHASAVAVPIALVIRGGNSVYPGEGLNLICEARYSDGSTRGVSPLWLILSGERDATISAGGVLKASVFANDSVTVKAIFLENGIVVDKAQTIAIKSDSTRSVVDIPADAHGQGKTEEFDASQTRVWYFDLSQRPEWVEDLFAYIASGSYKNSAYNLNYRERIGRNLASATAVLVVRAMVNDTGADRDWTFVAEDSTGNLLRTFVFRQKSITDAILSDLSVSGEQTLSGGERSIYKCEATFSDGTVVPVLPKWSVASGGAHAAIDANGVLTANSVTLPQTVVIQASFTSGSVTKTVTKSVALTQKPSTYTIEFIPNGGSGTMTRLSCVSNRAYNLTKCTLKKSGKRFAGWACSNGRRYDDGILVFDLAKPGEIVTMTATWE